ncbi:HNH endonuclease [Massilia cellulosiltytica]|nr:HNH endonuclease [Telluria cellulosilytica]
MKNKTFSTPDLQKMLRVSWDSGSEYIDLTEALNHQSDSENFRLCTDEIRRDGQTAFYYPVLRWISKDSFVLEYTDPGVFETGESAEGDLGTATYRHNDGTWTCLWKYAQQGFSVVKPKCALLDPAVERELELVRRAKRDRAFRNMILAADDKKCAITCEELPCLLDAAHVKEVKDDGSETLSNGLTLRKDIHALFDAKLIQINSDDGTIEFDKRLSSSYQALFSEFKTIRAETLNRIRENLLVRNGKKNTS